MNPVKKPRHWGESSKKPRHWLVRRYFCHWEACLCLLSMEFRLQACVGSDIVQLCSFLYLMHVWTGPKLQLWHHRLYIFRPCRRRQDKAQKLSAPVITSVCEAWIVPLLLSISLQQINPGVPISPWCFSVSLQSHWAGNLFLPRYWCRNSSAVPRPISAMVGHLN